MQVRFKYLREDVMLPSYGSKDAAALDLFLPLALEKVEFHHGETKVIPLGFKIEIPKGYVGKVKARSSMWSKGWRVSGFIDSDYRGEVSLMIQSPSLHATGLALPTTFVLEGGQKVAQFLIEEAICIEPVWADELTETARGEGGFGSTGNK